MTVKHTDSNYKLYPSSGYGSCVETEEEIIEGKEYRSVDGNALTPQGIVRYYSYYWKGVQSTSCLEIIKNGTMYYRRFDKAYTSRGLVTKAKQFAKDVFCIDDTDTNG